MKKLFLPIFAGLILTLFTASIPNASSVPSQNYIMISSLFAADNGESLIKLTPDGTVTKIATIPDFSRSVQIDSNGNYIVANVVLDQDPLAAHLFKITPGGTMTTVATFSGFPEDFAIDPAGNYIVADRVNQDNQAICNLLKITPGGIVTTITNFPECFSGVAIDSSGNYIVDTDDKVVKVTPDGTKTVIISGLEDNSHVLQKIAIDSSGNYNVIRRVTDDIPTASILRITPQGEIISEIGLALTSPFLSIDSSGNYIVFNPMINKLDIITPDGTTTPIPTNVGFVLDLAFTSTKTPSQAINDLIALGKTFGANTSVLGNAVKLLNDSNPHNDNGACGKLSAFINQVNANHSLTSAQKAQLVSAANAIKTSINC